MSQYKYILEDTQSRYQAVKSLNYCKKKIFITDFFHFFSQLQEFINKKGYPNWTQVTRVVEGGETPIFKQFFSGWRDEGEQVGMGKVFRQGSLGNTNRYYCMIIGLFRE